MTIRIVEFLNGGTKLERFLPENQHTQRKLMNLRIGIVGASEAFKNQSFKSQLFLSSLKEKYLKLKSGLNLNAIIVFY